MYSRSYYQGSGGMLLPENYDGTALSREEDRLEPETKINEHTAGDSELAKANADAPEGIVSALPFLGRLLPSGILGDLRLSIPKLGSEEILIIILAAYLFFSKGGDKECAVILLVLLLIN